MNRLIIILIPFFISCQNNDESLVKNDDYFHGSIKYSYTYSSDQLDLDSLNNIRPLKGEMIFENTNYQSSFYGKDTSVYIYLGDHGICYSYSGTAQECEDYTLSTDSIHSYKIYESGKKIMGQDCIILEFQSNYFWNRYYISKETFLDPESYEKHLAYNWNFYSTKTNGGLILGMEHRFKKFTMKGMAISIEEHEISTSKIDAQKAINYCIKN